MFARSLALVDKWIAELTPKAVAATAVDAKKQQPTSKAAASSTTAPAAASSSSAAAAASSSSDSAISKVAFLVGRVLEVANHPESEHLYVEQIDLGEPEGPRTIISGLREHVKPEEFKGKNVIVVANLEPRKMRGIVSAGMVLCASTEGKGKVMLIDVPDAAKPGERIMFPGHDGPAEPVLKKKLAKLYDDVAPLLKTDAKGTACLNGMPFVTSAGPCTCVQIPNGTVS